MINVGIIGGAGYTAGELIRILLNHPNAEIKFVHSSSNAGNKITDVHTDLLGDTDLVFTDTLSENIDVLFLCMGHGNSKKFLEKQKELPGHIKIIDLSHDYRLKAEGNDFVYGLPELNKLKIREARYIANPGCFATGIELALLPLAEKNLIRDQVHITAITGSTGAGQSPSATTHFSWRNNNISVYKAFSHQNLGEIEQSIRQLQPDFHGPINLVPMRGDFARGILASAYTRVNIGAEEAMQLYSDFYKDHPYAVVTETNPHLKQAVNTNKCIIYPEKHGDLLHIVTAIDNLVKGASGQAVQNMNLAFGIKETAGLNLKPSAF